jgi:F-type H+-transporting ATPase subunit b
MLVEAKEIIAKAKSEASLIREKATTEAKELTSSKLATAKANIDAKYNDFVKALEVEKDTLKESLVASMPMFKESLKLKISSI